MDSELIIKPHIDNDGSERKTRMFDVVFEGKIAIGLTYDEMLGLVTSITMPDNRPCLHWLKTPEQIKAWDEKYNKK